MEMEGLKTSDYYFDLPKELIAQDPLGGSERIPPACYGQTDGGDLASYFKEICSFLKPGDCLVLN